MRTGYRVILAAAALALALAACGDGDDDGGGSADASGADAIAAEVDAAAGAPDATPIDDDNDSFAEAIAVAVDGASISGTLDQPGDSDYFMFEGTAGSWLAIRARRDDFELAFLPVATLTDASQTQVAQGAQGATLRTHLAASGTYYVVVRDASPTVGDPRFTYTLSVTHLVDGVQGVVVDQEPGDDVASARPLGGGSRTDVEGMYEHAADRDVYAFTLDEPGVTSFSATPTLPGPTGNGSTSDYAHLWITDATGATILARVDGGDQVLLRAPLPQASYLLWVEKAATAAGANDFYDVRARRGFPEVLELETAPGGNDSIALAESSGEIIVLEGEVLSASVVSYLSGSDVDYVGFDVPGSLFVEAQCVARGSGSGLVGMTYELRSATDEVLASAVEPGGGLLTVKMPEAGRYYFRVTATGQDPAVAGNWVRCSIAIPVF